MTVSVVIPVGGNCPHRAVALRWVTDRYRTEHPDWEIVTASGDTPGGFSRSQGILKAARQASGAVLLVADGDVWCDATNATQAAVEAGWAIPHRLLHRLSAESTELVLAGADWRGLPLSTDNPQDSRPHAASPTGAMVAIRRDVLLDVPPDPRFVGWGQEDQAYAYALRCLVGQPWTGSEDMVHLWHPPQPRRSRVVGSDAGKQLKRRYQAARPDPAVMRALIEEAR